MKCGRGSRMIDVEEMLRTAPGGHALRSGPYSYVAGFASAIERVYGDRAPSVLQQKFGIPGRSGFDHDSYIQSAAELTVQSHVAQHAEAKNFAADKNVNSDSQKDVDV